MTKRSGKHVEAWKRWERILQNLAKSATGLKTSIEYPNLPGAWTRLFKGHATRGRKLVEEFLDPCRPATLGEFIELAANLPEPIPRGLAISHLAWIVSWEDAEGFPFIIVRIASSDLV